MRTLLSFIILIAATFPLQAGPLRLDGDLTWNITNPQAAFKLDGKIQNLGSLDTGTIKLVLWATKTPYPSPGYIAAERLMGQLGPGYQYDDFTVKAKANLPFVNGNFYFTIAVMEYTSLGWRNQLLVPTGAFKLYNGNFADASKWIFPLQPVIPPPTKLIPPSDKPGDVIYLTEKATGELNRFPIRWQERIELKVEKNGEMKVTGPSRKKTVPYKYTVIKKSVNGKSVSAGNIEMKYKGDNDVSYKANVTLYFQSSTGGTYKSVTTGSLWSETFGTVTTWGVFKLE